MSVSVRVFVRCVNCTRIFYDNNNHVSQVLDMVAPPYSAPFVHSLLNIVGSPTTSEALKNMAYDTKDLVKDFVTHCYSTDYNYNTSQKGILGRMTELFV